MTTKFYLAGKFSEGKDLLKYVNILESIGHECTHKWMEFEGATREEKAINDVKGVHNADYLIAFLTDDTYKYRGTLCEVGVALGLNTLARAAHCQNIKIYIVKPDTVTFTCFIHHHSRCRSI